ncbi:MAG: hypothetical protein ACOX6T_19305 [Myxococcales bacterium]|jgi:hypothetical protein
MTPALLLLVALAAPPKVPPKLEPAPKLESPKLEIELPELPNTDGLEGPARQKEPELRRAGSDLHGAAQDGAAKLESIVHARDFSVGAKGRAPVGRIDSFVVEGLPSSIPPFKSLLRLVSPGKVPAIVRVRIVSPGGEELLASRAEVSFGSNEVMELVIDWEGFRAVREGDYKVVVDVDGKTSEHPLALKAK